MDILMPGDINVSSLAKLLDAYARDMDDRTVEMLRIDAKSARAHAVAIEEEIAENVSEKKLSYQLDTLLMYWRSREKMIVKELNARVGDVEWRF